MNDISYTNWNSMSDDAISKQIGNFIRHHRVEQNKTQDELAKDAGISRSTLSLMERGETVTVASLIQMVGIERFITSNKSFLLAIPSLEISNNANLALSFILSLILSLILSFTVS